MARRASRGAPGRRPPGRIQLGPWVALALLGLIGLYAFILYYARPHVTGDSLNLSRFESLLDRGQVRTATLLDSDNYVVGEYQRPDGQVAAYNTPYLKEGLTDLVRLLSGSKVDTYVDQQGLKKTLLLASYLIPGLIFLLVLLYLFVSFRRGVGLFRVKSGAQRLGAGDVKLTFADVAGQASAVAELRQVGEFLADTGSFAKLGATIPKGVLLYGPPGCGKTLLARALAGEQGANFYSVSGSDFVEMYVGVGAARVRDLFAEARRNAPAVVFIDELDSIGSRRGGGGAAAGGSRSEQEQALHQILVEMDGFATSEGLVVLAATNRPDVLDPALLRPGRFDRAIGLERPDEVGRLEILRLHAGGKRLEPSVDLAAIARRAVGLSGADLANVMNEAALLAARERRGAIGQEQLSGALTRILEAPERQRRLSIRDRSFGRRVQADGARITFADVAGQDGAVAELREIEQFLTEPGRFAALGARIPRGILLYGPPGAGKTLLARALANEANATFFSVAATEFVEVYVGEGAARVRDLFSEARAVAPSIIFLDELDAVGRRRRGGSADTASRTEEHDQTLDQILTEMDGFSSATGVIVIGSTNRPDVLDPALLRPGRFDRSIGLDRPDERGRLEILQLHARDRVMAQEADLARVARRAIGLNGADLANLVNEAALLAARAGRAAVSQVELEEALDRILAAPDRQRRLSTRDRSFGRRFTAPEERVTFADVAGADEAVAELAEFRDYLSEPGRFQSMGARIPRGVLLVGPPGCGKTLLAKAVAGETNAAFFSVAASEFVELFVGEGAGKVRDLFAEARSVAPSIVFIDEIDAVGGHRGLLSFSDEREQTLNQILVELDGFGARSDVIVMAATNRPDRLDAALVRPGRFDRRVTVQLPDHRGRRDILALASRGKDLAPDVNLDAVAGLARGCSGADLANLVNEAALLATRRGQGQISMAMLEEALERAVLGTGSRPNLMSDEERRATAYHEAGHALVARGLPDAGSVHKLSIITRGHALGVTWQREESDRLLHSRSRLIRMMACALGGRAAEDIVLGEPSSGAASDLQKATGMARQMVRELGMSSSLGPLRYADEQLSDGRVRPYSEEIAAQIDVEVRRLVDEAYRMASGLLTQARQQLDAVALALVERETLTGDEMEAVLSAL